MTRTRAVLVGAAVGALALSAGVGVVSSLTSASKQAADPAHEVGAEVRTVLVSKVAPAPSEPGLVVRVQLRQGSIPRGETPAEVLTDEDCAPDATGISHCRNVLRLGDGRRVVVRHPHDMHQVPCLTPGERVRVRAAVA